MEQVLRTMALWAIGSKNPAADAARLQQAATIAPRPVSAGGTSAGLGRSFEDRMINEILPTVATKLGIAPASRMCRVTRHVAHCGDLAIHYANQVGMIELKNHSRALPVVDRRRFFDSVLLNHKHLNWAILVTSKCSVPHFSERGYVVAGTLSIGDKKFPLAFVCDIESLGPPALELAIRTVCSGICTGPQWKASELLERGEASRTLESQWGTTDGSAFRHPPGAVF